MKFLKKQNLSRKNIEDDSLAVDINGQVIMDTRNSLLIPKGNNTTDRPATPVNGHIRYNTTDNQLEAYQNSAWRSIRFKESATISKQTFGPGDDDETTFGLLSPVPTSADAIIVLVENVMQISTTNYTLVQNPSTGPNAPYASGWYLVFSEAVPLGKSITVLHGFDQ
jgi:hypothetical protein